MTKRRNFSDKFKAAVALEALRGDKTVQEIAAKRQLHPTQVPTLNLPTERWAKWIIKSYQYHRLNTSNGVGKVACQVIVDTLPHQSFVSLQSRINDRVMLADVLGQKAEVAIRDNQLLAKLGISQQMHAFENFGLASRDQRLVEFLFGFDPEIKMAADFADRSDAQFDMRQLMMRGGQSCLPCDAAISH